MREKHNKRISCLWLFVPQLGVLSLALLSFDKVSLRVFQWILIFILIAFPVVAYAFLLVLRPEFRRVWADVIYDTLKGTGNLLRMMTFRNVLRFLAEIGTDESMPRTREQWISISPGLIPRRLRRKKER